jgi:hypothetical protein
MDLFNNVIIESLSVVYLFVRICFNNNIFFKLPLSEQLQYSIQK